MLKKKSKIVLYLSPFIASIILIILFIDVKVPQSFNTFFEVNPSQKWLLSKGDDGQLISRIMDFQSSVSKDYSVVQFERGESMNLRMNNSILEKHFVEKGDTLGIIESSSVRERITELEGMILVAKSELAASSVGEKEALVEEKRSKVKFGEAIIEQRKLHYQRAEELFKKDNIPQQEYETALWTYKQAVLENEINKAQYEALKTGLKSEELLVLESTIKSYQREADLLKKRLEDFVITAPIPGELSRQFFLDTLLTINNTSSLILTSPLRYENRYYITEGDTVRLSLRNIPGEIKGKLISIGKEVRNLNGVQILFVNIVVDPQQVELTPGLVIQGEIILPKVTIKEFLVSLFKN